MSGETLASILRRLINADQADLPAPVAEALLRLHFPERDQVRVEELGTKSNFGTLTPEEASEYDAYISAGDLLALWQSKARLSLKRVSTAV